MKEIFIGCLVIDYNDYLKGNIISNVIVNIEDNMAKDIVTGEKFNLISINDNRYGVCNLINITNDKKVLQLIADYLVEYYDYMDCEKELPKVKRR